MAPATEPAKTDAAAGPARKVLVDPPRGIDRGRRGFVRIDRTSDEGHDEGAVGGDDRNPLADCNRDHKQRKEYLILGASLSSSIAFTLLRVLCYSMLIVWQIMSCKQQNFIGANNKG
jgi:hypothetical protein